MTQTTDIAREDLVGRVGAIALDFARNLPKAWHELNAHQQDVQLTRLEERCAEAIGDIVDFIASRGHEHTRITLGAVTFDGAKVKLACTASKHHPKIHDLADLAGGDVVLVLTNANDFVQTAAFPQADDDQGELELEEGDGLESAPEIGDEIVGPDGRVYVVSDIRGDGQGGEEFAIDEQCTVWVPAAQCEPVRQDDRDRARQADIDAGDVEPVPFQVVGDVCSFDLEVDGGVQRTNGTIVAIEDGEYTLEFEDEGGLTQTITLDAENIVRGVADA